MTPKKAVFIISIAVLTVILVIFALGRASQPANGNLDGFAQCLTAKGAVMYGADWCPHCQNQKAEFGASFRSISYVECPENVQKCISEKIEGYPTWKFPDGTVLEGEQTMEKLAEVSGCELTTK